jgi:hypothetical protein
LIFPTEISQADRQGQRYCDQYELPGAASLRLFFILEQIVEVAGGASVTAISIQSQAASLARWRIVQSEK